MDGPKMFDKKDAEASRIMWKSLPFRGKVLFAIAYSLSIPYAIILYITWYATWPAWWAHEKIW